MEETLSLPVNRSFDKRAVCTKSGQEPVSWMIYSRSSGLSFGEAVASSSF